MGVFYSVITLAIGSTKAVCPTQHSVCSPDQRNVSLFWIISKLVAEVRRCKVWLAWREILVVVNTGGPEIRLYAYQWAGCIFLRNPHDSHWMTEAKQQINHRRRIPRSIFQVCDFILCALSSSVFGSVPTAILVGPILALVACGRRGQRTISRGPWDKCL
jgi:hypothetical protein